MEIKINVRKKHVYILSVLMVLIGSILFVQGQLSSNYGHSSNDVYVTVGGAEKNLQVAIDDGSLMTPDDIANGIGVSQTWQNVKSSRALKTTYTNGGDKPIMIAVATQVNSGSTNNCQLQIFVDDVQIGHMTDANAAGTKTCFMSVIVPKGSTYRADYTYSSQKIISWFELK